MKRTLIKGKFALDSRDQRIFEAMISNLNSFLKDADRKVKNHPSSSLHVKDQIIVISIDDGEENKIESFPSHAIEFPEPHMGSNL